jgi:hypothetical protein
VGACTRDTGWDSLSPAAFRLHVPTVPTTRETPCSL